MASGRPHASWLRQTGSYLKVMGMAGLASAWAMAYLKDMGMTLLASAWAMVRRRPI